MAGVPAAPDPVRFSKVSVNSLVATFTANSSNGAAITSYQIGYGTSSSSPQKIVSSDRSTTITGLEPWTKYYFWSRARNRYGWSKWSSRRDVTTLAGAWVRVGSKWKQAVIYVRDGGKWKVAQIWVRQQGFWQEWGG